MAFVVSSVLFLIYFYTAVFLFIHIFVIAGVISSFNRERKAKNHKIPDVKISVIVPARDEEKTLPALFKSLLSQSVDNFEIILINDRSQDNTLEIMESFRDANPGRVKVIDNRHSFSGKNPKQMALSLAERETAAEGEVFLYTDADCQVPPQWVETMMKPFANPGTGLVFGTVTVSPGGRSLLERFQQYDHLLRYHYTAAAAGLNMPNGGFGNNLAVRRKTLDDIGGFEKLEYTVTEDAQLIARVRDTGKWKIFAQTSADSMVSTVPVTSWKELYLQELRWSTGAIHAPDINSRIGYGFIMYQLLIGIILFPLAFFIPSFFPVFFCGILCMLSVSLAYGFHLKPGKSFWLSLPVCLLIAQFLFPVVTAAATFKPSVIWKGNRLDM
ncbi:MAG: glycosyltransferase [Spirochaetia bacterium]|jgi:cellulose synthase/poly-beta-1,6-N-acetylglucosamine synthase-like glycosyltransferase|nr:glycosyltransferase [Spirochaetia bacterium]